jgi:hypothetical protein
MTQQEKSEIQTQKIIAGLKLALERLLVYKKQKNSPMVITRDGKVVEVSAEEYEAMMKAKVV